MVTFLLKDVKLEYDPQTDRFRHPVSGEWLEDPVECLAGWDEPDHERRLRWGHLVAWIKELKSHMKPEDLLEAEVVDFSEQEEARAGGEGPGTG
jgi:hypothetical protein